MKKVTAVLFGVAGQFKVLAATTAICAVFLAGLFVASQPAAAQTNVNEEKGMKPYDSWHGGDLDSVSMTNSGLVVHIPLVSFPQRGNVDLSFSVYFSTKQWATRVNPVSCNNPSDPNGCTPYWVPLQRGAQPLFGGGGTVEGAYVASNLDWLPDNECRASSDLNGSVTYDWSANVTAPDGNIHQFGTVSSSNGCASPPYRALDASGILQLDASTIVMSNGTRFNFGNTANTVTDANGNQITADYSTSWKYTDTLGRVVPMIPYTTTSDVLNCSSGAASAKIWAVPGLSGGTRTFKLCYSNVSVYTNFGQGGTEYGPANNSLLTSIVLPDLTLWTFSYDHWGNLTRLGFPTGGSISYTYVVGPITCGQDTPLSMIVTSRTVDANDGTGGHTWTYNYSGQLALSTGTYSGTNVVTSPDGNDTVHTITNPVAQTCSLFDIQVQHYQGSHTGGTLLETAATQYAGTTSVFALAATNVVPTQITRTLPGGHTSKVVETWDSGNTVSLYSTNVPVILGSLLQKDEYDFSNVLVRSTVNHYLWQDSATYKSNNFLKLMVSSTVKDGSGNQVAQTTYGHDEYGVGQPANSGITTGLVSPPAGGNIRGNITTVSHWLNTPTNSFISSTGTYFDTGMKASSTDPKGHTTTYTYGFVGAYMTQTNMPDTQMPDSGASIVHHVISGNYDFNTGLLTSFTDENGQIYTYTYDSAMLRLTEGDHPDGGKTLFSYPSATQVERQRLISGTTYDDYKVNFDGLGRPIQTQHSVPGATILTDTTYDVVGRTSTVSNPYYQGSDHGSDPTYGITTTQYDALSRATKTVKQDGSSSKVTYDDNCVTATDEAGKLRKVCSDALGRMVEVDEPNAASAGTNATASVTISGSLASVQNGTPQQPASNSALSSLVLPDGSPHIFYFGTNQHVYQLTWSGAAGWQDQDLTAATGGPLVGAGSGLSSDVNAGGCPHVQYVDTNQHVNDMWMNNVSGGGCASQCHRPYHSLCLA